MGKEHHVIIVPGLGDDTDKLSWATRHWRKHDLEPIVYTIGWLDDEKEFQPKLSVLVEMINQLTKDGDKVSLVGCSAGKYVCPGDAGCGHQDVRIIS